MKKIYLLLLVAISVSAASCSEQNDCLCTATPTKKAASGSAMTYPIYDWGSSCGNIDQNDIPQLEDNATYNIDCTEL